MGLNLTLPIFSLFHFLHGRFEYYIYSSFQHDASQQTIRMYFHTIEINTSLTHVFLQAFHSV